MASVKRKRVAKNTKKSWRKHVDVADVDDFLEDQRLEERLGVKVKDQSNDDLFCIDTSGVDADALPTVVSEEKKRPKSLRLSKDLGSKCYSILEKRSAVPDPITKRNPGKINFKVKKPVLSKKKVKPMKDVMNLRNIWDEEDKTKELNGLATWMTADTVRNVLQNTGFTRKRRPHDLKVKPSPLPAIEAPHPGISYNPALSDHLELLNAVAEKEAEIEKKEKHIERVTTKMFKKVPREEAERSWIQEMSVGIEQEPDSSAESGDYSTVNPPVQRKKKTLKKRRKLREERERLQKLEAKKLEKKKRSDVHSKLPVITKSIEKLKASSEETQKRRRLKLEKKIGETKILGPTRFEEPPVEFQRPCELVGSLRQLKPEGSVLSDRFSSLQKRNIMEPTKIRNIRRAKVKRFVKATHKMGWEPKGY